MSRRLAPPRVVAIEDLRRLARRRLPRVVFDYIDGAADDELTARANCAAFDQVTLRPRCAVDVRGCDPATTVLGIPVAMPLVLAPVGSSRLFYRRGEEAAAREAGRAGLVYTLSTLSGCRLEDVRRASAGPVWYQLYLLGGREVARAALARAQAAGYAALVVTIDTPVSGLRRRDARNGVVELLSRRPLAMLPHIWQLLARPRWLAGFVRDGGLMKFPNVVLPGLGPMPYADVGRALEQSTVTWDDLAWIRDVWRGPIVVKGVHTAEDARLAVDHGAAAVVVSNHGGRQLDGVHPTLRVLPEVATAVGDRAEVLIDGGVRRGADIARALALGARAVLAGRAYAYGLGAAGGPGVARAIEILRDEFVRTLKLLGCRSPAEITRAHVDIPADWLPAASARPPA